MGWPSTSGQHNIKCLLQIVTGQHMHSSWAAPHVSNGLPRMPMHAAWSSHAGVSRICKTPLSGLIHSVAICCPATGMIFSGQPPASSCATRCSWVAHSFAADGLVHIETRASLLGVRMLVKPSLLSVAVWRLVGGKFCIMLILCCIPGHLAPGALQNESSPQATGTPLARHEITSWQRTSKS